MTVTVYRIGYSRARTLDDHAYGSTLFVGRWHSLRPGATPRRVIYAASSRALAQLEKRVHANGFAPVNQTLFSLPLDQSVRINEAARLPDDWRQDIAASQAYGNDWLDDNKELALWVPSYVEPSENNMLINPAHADIGQVSED